MSNSSLFDIINGRKYKKCKDGQIRNVITKRCNKIKSAKSAKAAKSKSPIKKVCPEGKVLNPKTKRCVKIKVTKAKAESPVKKVCPEGKVLNPKTKRCIKIKVTKAKAKSPVKVPKKPNLFKKLFYPFINRVNVNIDDRIKYNNLLKKVLDINEAKEDYCMRLYKYDSDGKPIYRIGNKIILQKQIGKDSSNSVIYLSSLRDKVNKIYKYMAKLVVFNNESKKEIKLLKLVTNAILNHKCPHFPILYSAIKCNEFFNFDTKTSFIKSNSNNSDITKKQIEDIKNYPLIIQNNKKKQFYVMLNEVANGDLKIFLETYHNDCNLLLNAFAQIYLSLMFFYKETNHFHNDSHWGNFLYHKVKPGGYFHYKIFGTDYYLENLGFLWVIWDFGVSMEFKTSKNELIYVDNDFKFVSNAFFNTNDRKNGWLPVNYLLNNDFKTIIKKINKELFIDTISKFVFKKENKFHPGVFTQYGREFNFYYPLPEEKYTIHTDYHQFILYSPKNMNSIIAFILNIFKENKVIKTTVKPNAKIINEKPYTITPF